jgi:lipoic acid synthetase
MSATAPNGRKLLRLEVRNAQTPIEKKPEWIKTRVKQGPEYQALHSLVKTEELHTVCQEAGCPNIFECWEDREATFLIGGSQCTRRCDFCQIDTGKPDAYDTDEPRRVGESVRRMGLRYATVTSVARDDLEDTGAWLNAETVRQIHAMNPHTGVELLANEHNADPRFLGEIFSARPEVFAHNVETVPRVFRRIRPAFDYDRSLSVITQGHEAGLITKSNLILGMGEEPDEVAVALQDLHDHPVPASVSPPHAGRALGQARRVRRVQEACGGDRLPRRARGPARTLVVSSRTPVGEVDAREGTRDPRAPGAHRRG